MSRVSVNGGATTFSQLWRRLIPYSNVCVYVCQVLNTMHCPQSLLGSNTVEVWNKADLLDTQDEKVVSG